MVVLLTSRLPTRAVHVTAKLVVAVPYRPKEPAVLAVVLGNQE